MKQIDIASQKQRITELLLNTKRERIEDLLIVMQQSGYFTSPASTRYHSSFAGGLAYHSLLVYDLFEKFIAQFKLTNECPAESRAIAALLHDMCKVGAYVEKAGGNGYTYKRYKPKGHATLSLQRIKAVITLMPLEEDLIRYHMGIYGLIEFDAQTGEYTLRNNSMARAWYHTPVVKLFYFCDELASFQEKAEEEIESELK